MEIGQDKRLAVILCEKAKHQRDLKKLKHSNKKESKYFEAQAIKVGMNFIIAILIFQLDFI